MSNHHSPLYDHEVNISDSPEIPPAINDNWQARRELAELWADNVCTASCEGVFIASKTALPPASPEPDKAST